MLWYRLARSELTSTSCDVYIHLQVKTVYAMEILLALFGVGAFGVCLWGSILCWVTTGCCASTPTTVVAVSCYVLQLLHYSKDNCNSL